jgi:hypothetical protein
MARRLLLVLVPLALLAGTAAAASSSPRDPIKRHNAVDQAWAERIRVQRGDLGAGDWRVEAHEDRDGRGAAKECGAPNLSDLVETGSAAEPDFSRNGSLVSSGSVVFRTERELRTAFARLARTSFTKCFIAGFKRGAAATPGVRIRATASRGLHVAKLAPLATAGSVAFVISGPTATLRGRLSYYLLARRRASVVLMIASFERPAAPISAALERRLVTAVAQRLK